MRKIEKNICDLSDKGQDKRDGKLREISTRSYRNYLPDSILNSL